MVRILGFGIRVEDLLRDSKSIDEGMYKKNTCMDFICVDKAWRLGCRVKEYICVCMYRGIFNKFFIYASSKSFRECYGVFRH